MRRHDPYDIADRRLVRPFAHGGETDLRGITQQDLADLVGASRSFVSTLINEMKREGVLGNVGRILCVRDQKALRKIETLKAPIVVFSGTIAYGITKGGSGLGGECNFYFYMSTDYLPDGWTLHREPSPLPR